MPKRQQALEPVSETLTTLEPKKKKTAEKTPAVKTPAATHKRVASKTDGAEKPKTSAKRTTSKAVAETVAMEEPILAATTDIPQQVLQLGGSAAPALPTTEQIAARAYTYYVARRYQHGSDVEDWLRAERELMELA